MVLIVVSCWSLTDGLRCPAPSLWLTGNHFVGKLSATGQPSGPTQPSIHTGSATKY